MRNGMIGMLFVLGGLITNQFEAAMVKLHGKKYGEGGMFFNAIICLFSMFYFIVTDTGGLHFTPKLWIYGLVNSAMYATGFYAAYIAYKIGSFGLTRLFTSFGVIISTFYGIIFLKEATTVFTYIALVMIVVSLVLMNRQKQEFDDKEKLSVKWLIFVILVIVSNAIIAIIGRIQVNVFDGNYKNEFLTISLAGAALLLFILGAVFERGSFKVTVKQGFFYGASAGIFNGITNLLILITYNYLPLSVAAPVRSGLDIVISFLVSVVIYREKFTRSQLISTCIGIAAVALMNL